MPNVGPMEILVLLIIALVVFGPKRLPELGKSLGKGIREFRGTVSGDHDDEESDGEERRPVAAVAAPVEAPTHTDAAARPQH